LSSRAPRGACRSYTTLFRSHFVVGPGDGMDIPLVWDMGRDDPHVQAGLGGGEQGGGDLVVQDQIGGHNIDGPDRPLEQGQQRTLDRKSTRLNSSHVSISYAV